MREFCYQCWIKFLSGVKVKLFIELKRLLFNWLSELKEPRRAKFINILFFKKVKRPLAFASKIFLRRAHFPPEEKLFIAFYPQQQPSSKFYLSLFFTKSSPFI